MTRVSECQSGVDVSRHKIGGGDVSQRADESGDSITHKRYVSVGSAYSRTSIRLPVCAFVNIKTTLYIEEDTTSKDRAGQVRTLGSMLEAISTLQNHE